MNRPPGLAMLKFHRAADRTAKAAQATESNMTMPVQFDLQPSRPCPWIESIGGTLSRLDTGICCHYRITGDWNHLHWPELNPLATRRNDLWLSSCCELFIAEAGNTGYLELNVSPTGDWNCYEFTDYRSGMRESPRYRIGNLARTPAPPSTRMLAVTLESTGGERLTTPAHSDSDPSCLAAPLLEIGVAVVIKCSSETADPADDAVLYYYSLHPGTGKADFHNRNNFRINMEKGL